MSSAAAAAKPMVGSIEPVQSLEKGLEVLALLNRRSETSVAEVARGAKLPRTTALRLLETMRNLGYVDRGGRSKRYRLTIRVRSLSDGYDDEQWVSDIARPWVDALARQVVWPVLVATPMGSSMLWRENTDHRSPLALARYSAGFRVPIVDSAGGHIYLAYCTPEERKSVLDLVSISAEREWMGVEAMDRKLAWVRQDGYAIFTRKHHHEAAISVPILSEGRYLASLTMRYIYGAMPEARIVSEFLGPIRATAAKIGAEFSAKVNEAARRELR